MKSTIALCLLFSLLLLVKFNQARKEPEDYWKSKMRDQPIPEAVRDLFVHQDPGLPSDTDKTSHFAKDFETKANAIIYHSHGEAKRVKRHHVHGEELKQRHQDDKVKDEKLFLKEKTTTAVVN